MSFKIIMLGDVVGATGRKAVTEILPRLRSLIKPDLVIVNGENSAHGAGITPKCAQTIFAAGADGITGGDHSFDRDEVIDFMGEEPRLIRPLNMPKSTPGAGMMTLSGCVIVNLAGRVFMRNGFDDPFAAMEQVLETLPKGTKIVVDFHTEATSEINAFARYFDGRLSAVVGTHTHMPTADAHVLKGGTAVQSDLGMCGDYDSVIGVDEREPIHRFVHGRSSGRFQPAEGPATLCGCLIELSNETALAQKIKPIRIGPRLENTHIV